MTHVLWRVFLAATLLLLPFWRGDRRTSGAARGEVQAATSTLTTKKIKDVALGEVIQIGGSKFVKIGTNRFQAVEPYTCADPVLTYAGAVKNFDYTGGEQTFTAYAGCQYRVEVWGAQGNYHGSYSSCSTNSYGDGAYVRGTLQTSADFTLKVYVGGHSHDASTYTNPNFNSGSSVVESGHRCGAGGGASDIRTIGGTWSDVNSLRSRIIVAGGGGGTYYLGSCTSNSGAYGDAGGLTGVYGTAYNTSTSIDTTHCKAGGGTQTAGGAGTTTGQAVGGNGSFGRGGNGAISGSYRIGAGGGGGWYGGAGSAHYSGYCVGSGGGGSSYISGHTGCVAVTSLSDTTPKSGCTTGTTDRSCSLSPTGLSFTDALMIDGQGYTWTNTKGARQQMPKPSGGYYATGSGHVGSGVVRITRLN